MQTNNPTHLRSSLLVGAVMLFSVVAFPVSASAAAAQSAPKYKNLEECIQYYGKRKLASVKKSGDIKAQSRIKKFEKLQDKITAVHKKSSVSARHLAKTNAQADQIAKISKTAKRTATPVNSYEKLSTDLETAIKGVKDRQATLASDKVTTSQQAAGITCSIAYEYKAFYALYYHKIFAIKHLDTAENKLTDAQLEYQLLQTMALKNKKLERKLPQIQQPEDNAAKIAELRGKLDTFNYTENSFNYDRPALVKIRQDAETLKKQITGDFNKVHTYYHPEAIKYIKKYGDK